MTNASTLLSFAHSNHYGSTGATLQSPGNIDFADAIISDPLPGQQTAMDFEKADSELQRTVAPERRRIANFPLPSRGGKRRNFIETSSWEGVVAQVAERGVVAKLCRRYQDFPAEEAFIPWDEITPIDREIVKEGASFSWKVGYLEVNGQRLSVSHIEFRRIPNFSQREQMAAKAKAAEYSAFFHES